MKAMPLPFEEFQGKGVLDFSYSSSDSVHHLLLQQQQRKWSIKEQNCYVGGEPTSVLDSRRSPISSTMSSSLNGNGSADTNPTSLADMTEKCGNMGTMEDWESVLSESPNQEQSILRLIMGDVEDPSVNLNKLLQSGSGSIDFNGAFGGVDQGFSFEQQPGIDPASLPISTSCSDFLPTPNGNNKLGSIQNPNPLFSTPANPLLFNHQHQTVETLDEKPQIFNPQLMINQNQAPFIQNPAIFLPLPYTQVQEHNLVVPPPPKRLNHGPNYQVPKVQFPDSGGGGQDMFLRIHQQQQQQLQMLPLHLQQRPPPITVPTKQKMVNASGEELANHQLVIDQLFKASEFIESGNSSLAQGILARLNHQLPPIGKAFHRAAFYFKEALQSILQLNNSNSSTLSPFTLIFKIGAYKSFSEVSPILQFANFTCNQAILEALERFDRIHIIDFDIGYGGQWASLMQELAMRSGGAPTLKITAFASTSIHDQVELNFTQDSLKHFASEVNIPFEIEIVSLEALNSTSWALPIHVSEGEALAVNLPINSFSTHPTSLPVVLRFLKQLSPKIVVSLDRGCDRTDASFPQHMIHALQSYVSLLESLDAVNVSLDTLQKIERFLVQPGIEKIVSGRHRSPERTTPWRSLFLSSGFTPLVFSNFAESQAECLVQRTPVRGFHFDKRQSSLVLCWQRKELISASAWRC